MATKLDRQFEIIQPTLDRLIKRPLEVADANLLNPLSTSPVAVVDGEFFTFDSTGKLIRNTVATKPCWASADWRGDTGVQATKMLDIVIGGGAYIANTLVFDPTSIVTGSPLMWGAITIDGLVRSGLILHTGANIVLGYALKLPATNNSKLQFVSTLT